MNNFIQNIFLLHAESIISAINLRVSETSAEAQKCTFKKKYILSYNVSEGSITMGMYYYGTFVVIIGLCISSTT